MVLMLVSWLSGCDGSAPAVAPAVDVGAVLTRASIDLRGRLPSVAELEAAAADPAGLDERIDAMFADLAFGARVADLWAPVLRTRVDQISYLSGDPALLAAMGEEPLAVLSRVANEDLSYTELVTGDWTMANESTASVWPVEYPPGATGWRVSRYTDGRPSAGVLGHNALWWRYRSTAENLNRGRANAVARIFLCSDYSARPVHFERRSTDVFDTSALLAETQGNPACANCHSTLDPLASYLFGFWYFNEAGEDPRYNPGTERMWGAATGVAPGFYGAPGHRLDDLGAQLAGDPRFVSCAVETAWSSLLRRDADAADADRLTAHREAFIQGDLTLRALFRSIVRDPAYRSVGQLDHRDNLRLMTPTTLRRVIEDLTGFHWVSGGVDLLENDSNGLGSLAGGADGYEITREATRPNATAALVAERVAEAAALFAVAHDAERPADRRLFAGLDFTERPDTDAAEMRAAMAGLFYRILNRPAAPDGEEVGFLLRLWTEALAVEQDGARAWAVVAASLMRDPDFVTY